MDANKILEEMVVSSRQLDEAGGGRTANFEGADLAGVQFERLFRKTHKDLYLYLGQANFRRATLRGADLSNCDLTMADFSNADLEGANLRRANVNGARFTNANVVNADLTNARAWDVVLDGANLQGAKLKGIDGDSFQGVGQESAPGRDDGEKPRKGGPASARKIKEAAIASATEAAQNTELAGLSASDRDGLQEAAEDLWHHSGIPDLEAQFDDAASSEVIHGDVMWKVFQKAAVDALKARLKGGGGGKKAKNVVAPRKAGKAAPAKKAAPKKAPAKKAAKKPASRPRAR